MSDSIKQNPELRHFLRHVLYAIEELALGNRKAALYELESIKGMVSWGEDDEAFREWTERRWQREKETEAEPEAEEVQVKK